MSEAEWGVLVLFALCAVLLCFLALLDAQLHAAKRDAREWERDARFWRQFVCARPCKPVPVAVEVLPQFNPPVVVFSTPNGER